MNLPVHNPTVRPSQSPVTRRQALRSIAAGAALGATAAGAAVMISGAEAAPAEPDLELLDLGRELDAAWARVRIASKRLDADDTEANDDAFLAEYEGCIVICKRIIGVQATSLPGLLVKARVVAFLYEGEPLDQIFSEVAPQSTDTRCAFSLARDLVALDRAGQAMPWGRATVHA